MVASSAEGTVGTSPVLLLGDWRRQVRIIDVRDHLPSAIRLLPVNSDILAPVAHQVTLGIRESHCIEAIGICEVAALAELDLRRLRAGRLSQMGPPVGLKPRDGQVTLAVNLPRQAVSLLVIDW